MPALVTAQLMPPSMGQTVPLAEGDGQGGFWATAAPIIPHPMEFFFGLVVFAILYYIVKTRVVPRLEQIFLERTEAIEGGIHKAEEAQAAAQAALEQYNSQLHEARAEATRIREDAKSQGALIIAELRHKAQAEASRITEGAQKQIQAEREQAVIQLRGEVGRLSTQLASRIVGESLEDETRQRGIVERFLAELESGNIQPERLGAQAGSDDDVQDAPVADSVGDSVAGGHDSVAGGHDSVAGGHDAVAGGRGPVAGPGSGTGQDL